MGAVPDAIKTVPAFGVRQQTNDDAESLYGNASFVAPEQGNFSVSEDSPAILVGFKNFPMTGFGVTSAELKKMAGTPPIRLPKVAASNCFC